MIEKKMKSENNDYDDMGSLGPHRVGFSVPPAGSGRKRAKSGKSCQVSCQAGYLDILQLCPCRFVLLPGL